MAAPEDPAEHALVVKALEDGLSGGVNWHPPAARRILGEGAFDPRDVRQRLIEYVRLCKGDCVRQRREGRERWKDEFDYVYEVVIPYADLKHGLYVEMRLVGNDPDVPVARIVNAHPELK